jgi:hypothetical protein
MQKPKFMVILSICIFFGASDLLSAEIGERAQEHNNYNFREDDLNLRNSKIVSYYEGRLELRHCRGPVNQILRSEWGTTFTLENKPFVFKMVGAPVHQVGDIADFCVILEEGQRILFVYNPIRQPVFIPCSVQ